MPTLRERFESKVVRTGGCWEWVGAKTTAGYGHLRVGNGIRKTTYAHRVSYEIHHGPIPEGMHIDHACHNRACVNPAHLRLATVKQNNENLSGARTNSKTGVRGVFPGQRPNTWYARVGHNGTYHQLGTFTSLPEAEAAVTAKRNELFTHNDLDRKAA